MKDIQSSCDSRNIAIDRVGIKDLVVPLLVQQQNKLPQQVTARINIFVNLSSAKKATHMSRFVEIIEDFRNTPVSISMTNDIFWRRREYIHVGSKPASMLPTLQNNNLPEHLSYAVFLARKFLYFEV